MTKKLFVVFLVSLIYLKLNCQDLKKSVLIKNQINKEFFFDSTNTSIGQNLLYITYLGVIKDNSEEKFKIVIWRRIWGVNSHTNGIIYIYDTNNNYLGKYMLGAASDLPNRIRNNKLFFKNTSNQNCKKSITTKISFSNGIPAQIFLRCKGKNGDVYVFEKSD
jgi:hypothetical protein